MKTMRAAAALLSAVSLGTRLASAIEVNFDSDDSIKKAAEIAAKGMLEWYTGDEPGDTPGMLPDPYYWWEAGAMMGSLVDYWYYTGDDQFNDLVTQGMLHQVGDNEDYMPSNVSAQLGNDDQAFWAFAALQAAEYNYPNPPPDQPQWLALAQAVFNEQAGRWDLLNCGGGLRWQITIANPGYDYKNTISNGCFFNIAARLGKYTGNETYFEWADRVYDWVDKVGLITEDYVLLDGANIDDNCVDKVAAEYSYNPAVFLYGAATMWNQTGLQVWKDRVDGILTAQMNRFFTKEDPPNVLFEWMCENSDTHPCDQDQRSFKAYVARWMAATTLVAPFTADRILPLLRQSATYAAMQCCGGEDGTTCGLKWTMGATYDGGPAGPGEQMAALEVFQANLAHRSRGPLSKDSGATSEGDPNAGAIESTVVVLDDISTADRAGAWILVILLLAALLGGSWWMVT